ncbi:MAG: deoxyribonuclease IV [Nitrososphaeraceae archaeon]
MEAQNYKIGFHVSISGSISNSFGNAEKLGCSAFQIFSRNPRGWKTNDLDKNEIDNFNESRNKSQIDRDNIVVHMPYLPNLASPNEESFLKSKTTLSEEVRRCAILKIPYLVIHLGSHLGSGEKKGIEQIVNASNFAIDDFKKSYKNKLPVKILLENSAGQKNSIGSKFEEVRKLLDLLDKKYHGICFDTCHGFAAGYDLRTPKDVSNTLNEFDNVIGLKELYVLHMNDSKGGLNENRDRHEHIGLGEIGDIGFKEILRNKFIQKIPIIMETPIDDTRKDIDNFHAVLNLIKDSN